MWEIGDLTAITTVINKIDDFTINSYRSCVRLVIVSNTISAKVSCICFHTPYKCWSLITVCASVCLLLLLCSLHARYFGVLVFIQLPLFWEFDICLSFAWTNSNAVWLHYCWFLLWGKEYRANRVTTAVKGTAINHIPSLLEFVSWWICLNNIGSGNIYEEFVILYISYRISLGFLIFFLIFLNHNCIDFLYVLKD